MLKSGLQPVVGHICAVLVAAASFALITGVEQIAASRAFAVPVTDQVYQAGGMIVTMFLIVAFYAFYTAAIPLLVTHQLAKHFAISNVWYFVVCGGLTGFLLEWPLILAFNRSPQAPSLFIQALHHWRFGIPSGALGGLVYWFVTGRFMGSRKSATHGT